jgi:hypothetical protein
MRRSGLDPARVEDVIMAQSYPNGETPCVGRERSQPGDRFGFISGMIETAEKLA